MFCSFPTNGTDGRLYAAFCLVKINSTIHESSLLTDINRTTTDLSFDDIAVLYDDDFLNLNSFKFLKKLRGIRALPINEHQFI